MNTVHLPATKRMCGAVEGVASFHNPHPKPNKIIISSLSKSECHQVLLHSSSHLLMTGFLKILCVDDGICKYFVA